MRREDSTGADEWPFDGLLGEPETFEVPLSHAAAWMISQKVCPGPSFGGHQAWKPIVALRYKVNEILLKFDANPLPAGAPPDDRTFPLTVTIDEAWILDQVVPFDNLGGACTKLLLDLYRGLWARYHGLPLEAADRLRFAKEPPPTTGHLPDGTLDWLDEQGTGVEKDSISPPDLSEPPDDDGLASAS